MARIGGKEPADNQVELENLVDGHRPDTRFGRDDRVEAASLECRAFQSLYRGGERIVAAAEDSAHVRRADREIRRAD